MKNSIKNYLKFFESEEKAYQWMVMKNRAAKHDMYVLADGPDNNFAVMSLSLAVENGFSYQWSTK